MRRHLLALALLGTVVVLCLSPQAATPAVDAGSGPVGVTADATFTDVTGDSRGRLDVVSMHASSSGDRLDVRVRTREQTINSNEHIWVDVDTNNDGARDIGFYFRGGGAGSLMHVRYPGALVQTPSSLGTASGQDFGITFNLRLSGLGNPPRVRLSANTKEAPLTSVWDRAPDSGLWEFAITGTTPPPPPTTMPPPPSAQRPKVKSSFLDPSPPRAGQSVLVGANFVLTGTGRPARGGSLSCRGTLGPASLSGFSIRRGGLGACSFRLPARAAGSRFTGRVTLRYPTGSATASRSGRVTAGETLRLVDMRRQPSAPVAGNNFAASFAVELHGPDGRQRLARGDVHCTATIAGKAVGPFFSGYVERRAVCSWNIPGNARGSTFAATVRVHHRGLTATKTVRYRVS